MQACHELKTQRIEYKLIFITLSQLHHPLKNLLDLTLMRDKEYLPTLLFDGMKRLHDLQTIIHPPQPPPAAPTRRSSAMLCPLRSPAALRTSRWCWQAPSR